MGSQVGGIAQGEMVAGLNEVQLVAVVAVPSG